MAFLLGHAGKDRVAGGLGRRALVADDDARHAEEAMHVLEAGDEVLLVLALEVRRVQRDASLGVQDAVRGGSARVAGAVDHEDEAALHPRCPPGTVAFEPEAIPDEELVRETAEGALAEVDASANEFVLDFLELEATTVP